MGAYAQRSQSIVTVVKVIGEPWYTRMGEGAKEFGDENPSISTRTVGPARADSALQLRIVEDLIAKKWMRWPLPPWIQHTRRCA